MMCLAGAGIALTWMLSNLHVPPRAKDDGPRDHDQVVGYVMTLAGVTVLWPSVLPLLICFDLCDWWLPDQGEDE